VVIATERTANWPYESLVLGVKACVVDIPHKFHFVCELGGCEELMSAIVDEFCAISFGRGEEVAMFGSVVVGSNGGDDIVFYASESRLV
jgi:hypothetical protein